METTIACRRLLVVRNDRLGDFMLAWPALALLRSSLPDTRIAVLVPPYTEPLARECPWIDDVVVDPGPNAGAGARRTLLAELRRQRFDAMLTLFSTARIGWLGLRSGIPLRLAPATKPAQFLYPVRVPQRRSRSLKPEYVYNEDLARALLGRLGAGAHPVAPPYWPLSPQDKAAERSGLARRLRIPPERPWFFVHAGSGGSSNNLSVAQYAQLVHGVHARLTRDAGNDAPVWVLTAGPGEEPRTRELAAMMLVEGRETAVYASRDGLARFARSLAAADLFVAGSTGPLHVAGCLDVPTVGFFPSKRSSTALRWRPCNAEGRTLGLEPPAGASDTEMSRIDPGQAADRIAEFWRGLPAG
ncbi:ADP-heptose--lipooligosaccharide heptosyltransferase II [Thioalkalivibrio nitratireducens DSM 14787]|uniref:ADP-heptose--lipooligosaccharide heptosyltransferase II n=1 Tax=Thioalkalivibrio nitratireducens (strain DSM 14787 / UNIQEM 213 / ALEN2) TaxID=1255043 RepID=L0DXT4_THIND|nr:glycosyltransferase family 9 protein [Thioalkalivibrio nitratireducens]AGA33822.1 ADP-heptose--lipooligosaccharide heptosyltransferase II [Thioalkalivibrio nitratireducens DSM 14787]